MKIRPLHKIEKGCYYSDDKEWRFRFSIVQEGWFAYKSLIDNVVYYDTPYLYSPHPTLRSLIKTLEKAKP